MRVVVPFAGPSWPVHAVKVALTQDGIRPEFHHMVDEGSYHHLLLQLWEQGETFAVVEHDVVCFPGAIQELENCPEPFCTRPYYCSVGWITDGLGCTKFDAALMALYPNYLMEPFPTCCRHTRHYCGLDRLVAHRAQELGITPHVHLPGVSNLNERWT